MPPFRERFATRVLGGFAAIALGVGILAAGNAAGQAKYPDHPIRVLVGFAAGGPTDVQARKLAAKIGPILGQSVVVENKPGASTTIATAEVAKAKPDGYTLYFGGSGAYAITPLTMPSLAYDVGRDFAPIALVGEEQLAFAIHPSVPARTLSELASLIKANPGKYSFASSGTGNITHLTGELFKMQAGGMDMPHIAYKGAGPAANDVLAGHVPITVAGLGSVYPHHQAGKMRVLAISSERRTPIAGDIPTAVESGFPNLIATSTLALLAPAGTPSAILDALAAAVAQVMADEAYLKEMRQASIEPVVGSTPARTSQFLAAEVAKWTQLVKSANLNLQ